MSGFVTQYVFTEEIIDAPGAQMSGRFLPSANVP